MVAILIVLLLVIGFSYGPAVILNRQLRPTYSAREILAAKRSRR